jgi:hypothetical protein
MRYPAKRLSLSAAVLVVACLAAGCGSTASSIISNLPTPTRTTTATGGPTTPDTTAAPTTAAPTTAAPTTTAPTTTAPTTAAPTTSTVTVTATASAPAVSPSASATPGEGSGTNLLWLWILLGVAALAGLIAWIVASSRRRSAKAAGRQSRLIDAYAKGSALHDAMSVAEAPGRLDAPDAGARWADIQRRADDLTQTLYALREAVPDPADQARIADVLASLQAIRSAMDAERAPGGASPQQAEVVRNRLYAFEQSLRWLRRSDQEFS